jgi:hypothetical protein
MSNFDDISNWDYDGILVYECSGKTLIFTAWRPDKKTSGVFEHCSRVVDKPVDWGVLYSGIAHQEGNVIVVEPIINGVITAITVPSIFLIYFGCLLIAIAVFKL